MNITILSCFRNASHYIPRYFDQVGKLSTALAKRGDKLTLVLGYGDSTDDTDKMLRDEVIFTMGAQLVDVSHGGKHYGSVVNAQRFKQLAYVGNKLLDCVPSDSHVVVILESDLIWDVDTLAKLTGRFYEYDDVVAIAPMVKDLLPPERFYDTWAFRRNGFQFTKEPPFHPDLIGWKYNIMPVSSAGSVLAMMGHVARGVRFPEEDVIVGLCKQIWDGGGNVWLDPSLTVYHP